jgi:hypothetical protein
MIRALFLIVASLLLCTSCFNNAQPSVAVLVLDESGMPVAGARVALHLTRLDWADYKDPAAETTSDTNGLAVLEAVQSGKYFVNISKSGSNNRFGKNRTESRLEEDVLVEETFQIRPPTPWERFLGGQDHRIWTLAPLMTPQGQPFLDYPVDTDMFIDGRWLDSNGRLGLWWFNESETKIYYDYATSGAVVESRMISLTEDLFQAEIDFFGIRMRIEMFPS